MPHSNLNVAIVPVDMTPGNPKANLNYVEKQIRSLHHSVDLVVLPEMCNTGFSIDREEVSNYAEAPDGYSMKRMQQIARDNEVAIWGTMAIAEEEHFFNRGFMVDPAGEAMFYDKRHLFVLGEEPALYSPGERPSPIVEFKGWRLKMAICYDLRFPVWTRWTAKEPYDALIIPANWPEKRNFAWRSLLIARAIENQAYVLGCNRLGSDAYGAYNSEMSYIFDCWGNEIGHRNPVDGVITATLDGNTIDHARTRFPNLGAADNFTISL